VTRINAARPSRLALILTLPIALHACGLWLGDEARIARAHEALDNQQYSAAIIDLKTVLQNAPDNGVARGLLGRALAASGELEAAEQELQRALELGQPLADIRVSLAEARLVTGQPEQALLIADPTAAADSDEAFLLWLYRGDAQAELGETVESLRSYEQAERLNIDRATALLRAAELYWGAGNLGDAREFTELAQLDDPHNLDAHFTLGAILLELESWQEAEETLTHTLTALQLDPVDRGYVLAFLAEIHLAQDNVAAAREASDRVAELWSADDPDLRLLNGQIAMAEGDSRTAATELSAYLADFPESEVAMRTLGAAQFGRGLINLARIQLLGALESDPDQIETRNLLARVYLEEGQMDRAREVLEPALKLAPGDPVLLSVLGILDLPIHPSGPSHDRYTEVRDQLIRGEIGRALVSAYAVVRDHQFDPRGLNLLGLCQLANGQVQQAIDSFVRALAAQPDNDHYRLNLARAHLGNSAPGDGLKVLAGLRTADLGAEFSVMRRALLINLHESNHSLGLSDPELLSHWLDKNPNDADARLLLAEMYIDQGSFADASAQYELLLDQGLDDPVLHNNLAWSYLQLGDSRAREQAEIAFELAPDYGEVVDTLGWILVSQGELEKGSSLLRDAHILQPGEPAIVYHLAYALSRTDAEGEAKALLERLLEHGADTVGEPVRVLLSELQKAQ